MSKETETRAGALLARRRWDDPETVDRRVGSLAERIAAAVDKLPPLTPAQRAQLVAAIGGPR
jgi:hypothetical protein